MAAAGARLCSCAREAEALNPEINDPPPREVRGRRHPTGAALSDLRPSGLPGPPPLRPPDGFLNVSSPESPNFLKGGRAPEATAAGTEPDSLHRLPFKTHTFQLSPSHASPNTSFPRPRRGGSAGSLYTAAPPGLPPLPMWEPRGQKEDGFWGKKETFASEAGATLKEAADGAGGAGPGFPR